MLAGRFPHKAAMILTHRWYTTLSSPLVVAFFVAIRDSPTKVHHAAHAPRRNNVDVTGWVMARAPAAARGEEGFASSA